MTMSVSTRGFSLRMFGPRDVSRKALWLAGALAIFIAPDAVQAQDRPASEELTVMTMNLYLGASLRSPLEEATTLLAIPSVVGQLWAAITTTNYPERARALADEIAAVRPHVVGLQEVMLFRAQSPGDFILGNAQSAEEVTLDFLAILLTELQARGATYTPVATSIGTDLEFPSDTGDDLRLTDRDVILARADVVVANPQSGNYAVNLEVQVGGATGPVITLPRGWVSVDVLMNGHSVRIVSTHLETAGAPSVQAAQAQEFLQVLDASPIPLIAVGDFNSAADGSTTPTYGVLKRAGLEDAWSAVNPQEAGFTCCQAGDLLNAESRLGRRIDLIFTRDVSDGGVLSAGAARVVGNEPADRTPSGLWPSDHAGVAATLLVAAPVTAVAEERGATVPGAFALKQNYPNPFNAETSIRFDLDRSEEIGLSVYSSTGQKVASLAHGPREAGSYTLRWDGRDDRGGALATGVYFYRLQAGKRVRALKLVLTK